MRTNLAFVSIVFVLALLIGCTEQDNIVSYGPEILQTAFVGDSLTNQHCVTLIAGQTIDVGTVCCTVENDELCITYATIDDWELVETHLWIGEDLSEMPRTKHGNPKIGHFPYHSGDITGDTTYTVCIPIDSLGGEPYVCDRTFLIAAHAVVRRDIGGGEYQTETGWGEGERINPHGNWAMYFDILLTCDGGGGPGGDCETAFAYSGNQSDCFLNYGFSRWGWSVGPLGTGTYTYDIWAAAGQCILSNGTMVGTLSVDYDGSDATVVYSMISDFTMDVTHLYVGSEQFPRGPNNQFTVAPGQYPYSHELTSATSDTFEVTGLSGDVYVIAHAVVCGTL